jgi:hypothetical protein
MKYWSPYELLYTLEATPYPAEPCALKTMT